MLTFEILLVADYLRQADGYPSVVGYEELDSGIAPPPRPEYHPAQNTHPNYGRSALLPTLHALQQYVRLTKQLFPGFLELSAK